MACQRRKVLKTEHGFPQILYLDVLFAILERCGRIPFFFEANFDALVKPLPAISRLPEADQKRISTDGEYPSVVYGDFLKNKVGSNFSKETPGKGRY
ncbi:hypothetical protein FRC03_010749 [Tulasnella sp. 419]|nr:hypothetical protein FRC03_010749 [Tulasnella sp. 419]